MGKARLPSPPQKRDQGTSTSRCPPPASGQMAAAPSELAYGFRSTAATYASSASTSLSAYADLPGHHLRSALDLFTTPPVSSYPEDPTSGEDEWAGADFSGCGDPETLPPDQAKARRVARRAKTVVLLDGEMYKRSPSGFLMRCITRREGIKLLEDIHLGACGHHAAPRMLVGNAFRPPWLMPHRSCEPVRDASSMLGRFTS